MSIIYYNKFWQKEITKLNLAARFEIEEYASIKITNYFHILNIKRIVNVTLSVILKINYRLNDDEIAELNSETKFTMFVPCF